MFTVNWFSYIFCESVDLIYDLYTVVNSSTESEIISPIQSVPQTKLSKALENLGVIDYF